MLMPSEVVLSNGYKVCWPPLLTGAAAAAAVLVTFLACPSPQRSCCPTAMRCAGHCVSCLLLCSLLHSLGMGGSIATIGIKKAHVAFVVAFSLTTASSFSSLSLDSFRQLLLPFALHSPCMPCIGCALKDGGGNGFLLAKGVVPIPLLATFEASADVCWGGAIEQQLAQINRGDGEGRME